MPLIQTAGLFAAGLLTTSGLFTGAAPTTDDGPRIPCGAVWSQLPEDLQADLKAVRALPVGESLADRADALEATLGEALHAVAVVAVEGVAPDLLELLDPLADGELAHGPQVGLEVPGQLRPHRAARNRRPVLGRGRRTREEG